MLGLSGSLVHADAALLQGMCPLSKWDELSLGRMVICHVGDSSSHGMTLHPPQVEYLSR